jgi:hypothetical protein
MVSIDNVYKTVLTILNKEKRGYITPREFNDYARQAQLEIFESYFSGVNRSLSNNSDYSDTKRNVEEKISFLENEATIATGSFTNASGVTTSDYFAYPSDFYRLSVVSAIELADDAVAAIPAQTVVYPKPAQTFAGFEALEAYWNGNTAVQGDLSASTIDLSSNPFGNGSGLIGGFNIASLSGNTAFRAKYPLLPTQSNGNNATTFGSNVQTFVLKWSNGATITFTQTGVISLNRASTITVGDGFELNLGQASFGAATGAFWGTQMQYVSGSGTITAGDSLITVDSIPSIPATTIGHQFIEGISNKKFLFVNKSPFTKPSITSPVYLTHENGLVIKPTGIPNVSVSYVRKPSEPQWVGGTANGQIIVNTSGVGFKNFELHPSEETELVAKILTFAGVTLRAPDLVQATAQKESQIIQSEQ